MSDPRVYSPPDVSVWGGWVVVFWILFALSVVGGLLMAAQLVWYGWKALRRSAWYRRQNRSNADG